MTKEQTPPLVSDERISNMCRSHIERYYDEAIEKEFMYRFRVVSMEQIRDIYEADRQKTLEVVQALVDAIVDNAKYRLLTEGEEGDTLSDFMNLTLNAAIALAKSQLQIEPTKP